MEKKKENISLQNRVFETEFCNLKNGSQMSGGKGEVEA